MKFHADRRKGKATMTRVKAGPVRQKSNLVCITPRQMHILVPNFETISQRTDACEKFGKPSGRALSGLIDTQTDGQTAEQTDGMTG